MDHMSLHLIRMLGRPAVLRLLTPAAKISRPTLGHPRSHFPHLARRVLPMTMKDLSRTSLTNHRSRIRVCQPFRLLAAKISDGLDPPPSRIPIRNKTRDARLAIIQATDIARVAGSSRLYRVYPVYHLNNPDLHFGVSSAQLDWVVLTMMAHSKWTRRIHNGHAHRFRNGIPPVPSKLSTLDFGARALQLHTPSNPNIPLVFHTTMPGRRRRRKVRVLP